MLPLPVFKINWSASFPYSALSPFPESSSIRSWTMWITRGTYIRLLWYCHCLLSNKFHQILVGNKSPPSVPLFQTDKYRLEFFLMAVLLKNQSRTLLCVWDLQFLCNLKLHSWSSTGTIFSQPKLPLNSNSSLVQAWDFFNSSATTLLENDVHS